MKQSSTLYIGGLPRFVKTIISFHMTDLDEISSSSEKIFCNISYTSLFTLFYELTKAKSSQSLQIFTILFLHLEHVQYFSFLILMDIYNLFFAIFNTLSQGYVYLMCAWFFLQIFNMCSIFCLIPMCLTYGLNLKVWCNLDS